MENTKDNLRAAVRGGELGKVVMLLKVAELKSQLSAQERNDLLRSAIDLKHTEIAKILLTEGFEPIYPETTTYPGLNLFYRAVNFKDADVAKLLISLDTIDISTLPASRELRRFAFHGNPLCHAIEQNAEREIIEQLIDKRGFDINKLYQKVFSSKTPLQLAAQCRNIVAVEVLLRRGADVDLHSTDFNGGINDSPLNIAVKMGDEEMVKLLLKFNANVNKATSDGKKTRKPNHTVFHGYVYDLRPLDIAYQRGLTRIAEILLAHGGKVGAQTQRETLTKSFKN